VTEKTVAGRYLLSLAGVTVLVGSWLMIPTSAVSTPVIKEALQVKLLLSETDNGRTVDIRMGEKARITLPENATTGYRWAIDHVDENYLEVLTPEPSYTAGSIGSGGEVAFTFQGKKFGIGEIMLKQWRSWEGDSSVTTRFRIRLNIRP
jgi:inhibitor of cysteine peptidase